MKVALLTMHSPEYQPLADITLPLAEKYCARHGYDLIQPMYRPQAQWRKLHEMRVLITDKGYDMVMWIGADVLIMNHAIRIEDAPPAEIILATDLNGVVGDVIIIRNGPRAEMFLHVVGEMGFRLYQKHPYVEQEAMQRFALCAPYADHVAFMPQEKMNSYLNREYSRPESWPGQYHDGDWILHFPGLRFSRKIELAREWAPKAKL